MTKGELELVLALNESGGCDSACGLRLKAWGRVRNQKSALFVLEHCKEQVPVTIPLMGESSPDVDTFLTLQARWKVMAPTFHANPGSESDWRKKLGGVVA